VSPDLQAKIFEKYPKIFKDANKSPQETCMCWGLDCGDGWYNLIDTLCEAITCSFTTSIELDGEDGTRLGIKPFIYKDAEPNYRFFFETKAPQVVADQVKEKFGTLRFYFHLEFDEINKDLVKTGKYPQLVEINKRYAHFIDGIVHFAEIASGRTCEITGEEGEMHEAGGWFKVLNKELIKQEKFKKYKLCENNLY